MKCTVPGANVKVLARAIHALSRIGEELYVEPDINSVSFRSVNSSRSAYASFTFNRPFFSFYKYDASQSSQNSTQTDTTKCKISMKSCVPVFKSPVLLERKVENCIMRFEDDGSKLVFEMRCRHGIIKTHYLPVIECETLQVVYTKDDSSICLLAQVQVFSEAAHHFHTTQEEVTLEVSPDKITIRSFIDNACNPAKQKHTEVFLDPREFDEFSVNKESSVTFCHKEFRALLQFAEGTCLPVEACFDIGGRPIVFGVKSENTYEASFVLSTLAPDTESTPPTPQHQRAAETGSIDPPDLTGSKQSAPRTAANSRPTTPQPSNTRPQTSHLVVSNARPQTPEPSLANARSLTSQPSVSNSRPQTPQPSPAIAKSQTPQPSHPRIPNSILNKRTPPLPPSETPPPLLNSANKRALPSPSLLSTSRASTRRKEEGCATSVAAVRREYSQNYPDVPENPSGESASQLSNGLQVIEQESSLSLRVRESDDEYDSVAPSPEPVRKRVCRLSQIFERTFDPRCIPGHDVILAGDSGEEDD